MRAVQLALLLMAIQVMGALINSTGEFGGSYYEGNIYGQTNPYNTGDLSVLSDTEQNAVAFNIMDIMWKTLAWGWITQYAEPLYSNVEAVRNVMDAFAAGLTFLMYTVIGISFIQFLRNQTAPLTSG